MPIRKYRPYRSPLTAKDGTPKTRTPFRPAAMKRTTTQAITLLTNPSKAPCKRIPIIDQPEGTLYDNKVRCGQSTVDAIEQPTQTSAIRSVRYFDLQGRPVSELRQGILIKAKTLTDGTIRTRKVKL